MRCLTRHDSAERSARAPRRDGIVLDLVQRMDVRAKRVPWLQPRHGMRAPVSAAAARVRATVHRLHAAAVLHVAAGRLLPQARSALDSLPHLQSA